MLYNMTKKLIIAVLTLSGLMVGLLRVDTPLTDKWIVALLTRLRENLDLARVLRGWTKKLMIRSWFGNSTYLRHQEAQEWAGLENMPWLYPRHQVLLDHLLVPSPAQWSPHQLLPIKNTSKTRFFLFIHSRFVFKQVFLTNSHEYIISTL